MKYVLFLLLTVLSFACQHNRSHTEAAQLVGTWKLLSATVIEGHDTVHTDYTQGLSFIKIINATHFAFLQHNLNTKDTNSGFTAGGGRWQFSNDTYTERLEYCSDRAWEGHDFSFAVRIKGDTLVQTGTEKIEAKNINRLNTETYIRLKP